MARHTQGSILRLGAVSLVVLLVVMAAAFNLQKFPGFKGTDYHVQLADASGLHKGNMVQIAGIRVGRVDDDPDQRRPRHRRHQRQGRRHWGTRPRRRCRC